MSKYSILLIEDDESSRVKLADILKKEGLTVCQARDGQEGIDYFKETPTDIVITDLNMPGMDGLEVIRKIKALSPHVQIIMITAFGETDSVIAALREGALDYIKKPIDLEHLAVALGRAKEKIDHHKKTSPYPTVLLAEDHDSTRNRLKKILTKEGWNVLTASDGEMAIEKFKEVKTDIVLLDINMPKKNGIQTLHELRELSSDFEAIIITGYGDESSAIQALRDGAMNFIRKPIDLDQILIAMDKGMDKLRSDRSLKYRMREIELSEKIIAKITSSKEIVIDLRGQSFDQKTRVFAQKLLDAIPISFMVVEKDLKIIHISKVLQQAVDYRPETFDEEYINQLNKIGLNILTLEQFSKAFNEITNESVGSLKTISLGNYSSVILTLMTILENEQRRNVVVIVFRGERKRL